MVMVTSAAYEIDHDDITLLTALTKVYCTENCNRIAQNEYLSYGCSPDERFQLIQDLMDMSILRITEGPNDPVAYRCALEIVTKWDESVIQKWESNSHFFRYEHAKNNFDIYKNIIADIHKRFRPFSGRQLVFSYVMGASAEMYSWYCAVLILECLLEQKEVSIQEADKIGDRLCTCAFNALSGYQNKMENAD